MEVIPKDLIKTIHKCIAYEVNPQSNFGKIIHKIMKNVDIDLATCQLHDEKGG